MRGTISYGGPNRPPQAGPVLGVDTAGRSGSVAIASSGKIEALTLLKPGRTYAESLASEVFRLLKSRRLEPRDLAGVAVSAGPGSFTGLRIAIGTALGMVAALGIPIVGVETLWAWALALGRRKETVCPALDAGKGCVFSASFLWEEDRLVRRSEDSVLSPEALCDGVDGPAVMWGDGAERFSEVIGRLGGEKVRLIPRPDWPAVAGEVALCGETRIRRGDVDSPAGFRIRYVREPEAEVQWRRRYQQTRIKSG
ncbi:MAG: tRNA (adenosine(37)-N6)-threonylcarbamoyltransferase complex dimerization subunit type 1 TsaB [bacterium]